MSERRKVSTRVRRETLKRRHSLSPPPAPRSEPTLEPEEDEGLPTKLKDNQRLPTVKEPQSSSLSSSTFQEIAECGVLAASIERSRQKWLHEGLFERYWTKPSKKKPQVEANNPDKSTMHRLGICSMVIEPHVFEITLFQVKEAQYTFLPPAGNHAPTYMNGAESMAPMYHSHSIQRPAQPKPPQTPNLQSQATTPANVLPPFHEGFAQFDPSGPRPQVPPPSTAPRPAANDPPLGRSVPAPQSSPKRSESSKAAADAGTDPIIHMLAQRAASDPHLKTLMRIVASGGASESQLEAFQVHITELKAIRKRKLAEAELEKLRSGQIKEDPDQRYSQTFSKVPQHSPTVTAYQSFPTHVQTTPSNTVATLPPIQAMPLPPNPQYPPQSRPIASKTSSIPVAIAFEFHAAPGDRYLFPRMSILEYLPGGTSVLASFLLIRPLPSNASSKTAKESYQPVTVRLGCHDPHVLRPLERVVAGKEEVSSWMEGIMKKLPRAEDVYLAMRLPREKGGESLQLTTRDTKKVMESADVPRARYSPPNSLMPLFSVARAGAVRT